MKKVHLLCLMGFSAAAIVFSTGCAGEKANAAVPARSVKKAAPAKDQASTSKDTPAPRSVFTIDHNSNDPFFPKSRKTAAAAPVEQQQLAGDVSTILGAGLQGIGGTAEQRIAIINNVILEPGRSAVIPVKFGTQAKLLPVKCREINRQNVVLEIEGYGRVLVSRKEDALL